MNLLRKLRLFGGKGRLPDGSRERLMEAFRVKYSNFKTLLESNTELLKIISDIELKLRGQSVFGASYIEAQTMRSIFHSARMVLCLENMSGRPYPALQKNLDEIHRQIKIEKGESPAALKAAPHFTEAYPQITRESTEWVGAKNANIGEIRNHLQMRTPDGFAITTAAFRRFIQANDLNPTILRLKSKADIIEAETILQVSQEIQQTMMAAQVPQELAEAMEQARRQLVDSLGGANRPVNISMRSSAIGEDSALSFAGQYLTVLNVPPDRMLDAYKKIVTSLFSAHAIAYRLHMAIPFQSAAMAVACQEMIASRASGVMFTRNPINPLENRILINAVWGLGPYAVDGIVPPDTYIFSKENPPRLLESRISEKKACLVATADGELKDEAVPAEESSRACLTPEQAEQLAVHGLRLEAHFGIPQDVEWALDEQNQLVILQSRPLRVDALETGDRKLQTAPLTGYPVILEGGDIACAGIGFGRACHVRSETDLANFPDGGVLVSAHASAQLVMIMPKTSAILADAGNITGHMASLAREYMIPTILNLQNATASIAPGTEVTVDAYNGRVYHGRVPELIESGFQLSSILRNSPSYQALRRRADLIVPLNLTDPKSPRFAPEHCRTIHDIMRFIHEKSYEEIFQLGDLVTDRGKLSVRLKAHIPIDLYIIDLGGGLSVDATQVSKVTVQEILSAPLEALLGGMLCEDMQCRGPRPIHLGGLASVMTNQWLSPPNMGAERFGDRSYAIISDRYLNFSSRVGYHYSILDCYCGQTSAKNYINFQFKGGAADPLRRNRRARVIEKVLSESGFVVDTVADRVTGRIGKQEAPIIKQQLDLLGRLLIYTRQMDMLMHSELLVDKLAECFLKGNYTLNPELDEPVVGCTPGSGRQ
jgi:pyruvate, water dikinase